MWNYIGFSNRIGLLRKHVTQYLNLKYTLCAFS
jgi:hypothetical protein